MTEIRTAQARRAVRARLAVVALGCLALFVIDAILVGLRARWIADPDTAVSRAAARAVHTRPWLVDIARIVTELGNPFGVDVAVGLLTVVLAVRGRWRLALAVVLARLVALGVEHLVKALLDRARPHTVPPVAIVGGNSFPSGHSSGAATVAVAAGVLCVLLLRSRRAAWVSAGVLMLLACAVAVSRVLLVVHYPSDVVGGLLLGAASATGAIALLMGGAGPARPTGTGPSAGGADRADLRVLDDGARAHGDESAAGRAGGHE